MINCLVPIILQKQKEVLALKKMLNEDDTFNIAKILTGEIKRERFKSLKLALNNSSLAVIAEIKRQSPSKGMLASITDPIVLAETYVAGGANAISILTDELFFGGKLEDLSTVAKALHANPQPILRKDFVIDEIQIAEAINSGADAILAIVSVLGEKTKIIIERAHALGVEVLVEIHDKNELQIALDSGAQIIGVNNRDLTTLKVDTNLALQLIKDIPTEIIKIAESGITDPKIAREYYHAGFNAVLIGEALVKTRDPIKFIQECQHE